MSPARPRPGARPAIALVLLLLLAIPLAEAHIQGARPILQRGQRERVIGLDPGALDVGVELSFAGDPLRQYVTHTLDPARGLFGVEHREDASIADGRFRAEWKFERLVEYRDANVNGRFEPHVDAAIKAWRFQHYRWEREELRTVRVSDVQGNSVVWHGNLTNAPKLRYEVVIAGKDFVDEGAVVRPQDVAIYMDLTEMPPRGLGSLYALEASVKVQPETTLSLHQVDNTSTALLADAPARRALLLWGGEALLDGVEQRTDATIEDERIDTDGMRTAKLVIHVQTVDRSMKFIMVSGVEYVAEDRRAPLPAIALLLGGIAIVALGRTRRA